MSSKKSKFEKQLEKIHLQFQSSGSLTSLQQFLYKHKDQLNWYDWSTVYISFSLTPSFMRQFRDYMDWGMIYQWATQHFVDNDLNLMRQFKNEMKWIQKSKPNI